MKRATRGKKQQQQQTIEWNIEIAHTKANEVIKQIETLLKIERDIGVLFKRNAQQ